MNVKNRLNHWVHKGIILLWIMLGFAKVSTVAEGVKRRDVRPIFGWRIHNKENDTTVFLVGSIHFGKKEFYPLPKVIEEAFKESDGLAVEVDITMINSGGNYWSRAVNFIAFLAVASLLYHYRSALKKSLHWFTLLPLAWITLWLYWAIFMAWIRGKEITRLLYKTLRRLELNFVRRFFIPLMPSNVVINTLRGVLGKKILGTFEWGAEMHFIPLAKEMKKPVIALETVKSQMSTLSKVSLKKEPCELLKFLTNFDKEEALIRAMLLSWQTGDTDMLYEVVQAYNERYVAYEKILLTDRDGGMASKIKGFLAEGKHVFVLVGAMHCKGILSLLAQEGYVIEQLYEPVGRV